MTPAEFRSLARESADMGRMARFYQLALVAGGRTELALQASAVAGALADGHSIAAIQLDQAASHLAREGA